MAMAFDRTDVPQGAGESRACLAAKMEEAATLRDQIEQTRFNAQQLRLELRAAGVNDPSLVPARLRAGNGGSEAQHMELRSMLQWLMESVDLKRHVVFECGAGDSDVMVGGRRVQLQRMATWPILAGTRTVGLKLSVPLDMQVEIAEVLLAARSRGRIDELEVQRLAESWEMVGAEVASAHASRPEPAVFLVRRDSAQAMIIGHWPAVDFVPRGGRASAAFDPVRHFSRLAEAQRDGGDSEVEKQQRPSVCTGDRVEVEYKGQWFSGLLQGVNNDLANIQCDVDSPGVITVAPLTCVRPAREPAPGTQRKMPRRHMRARSMG